MSDSNECGVVTLIFYKLQDKWWNEPALNLIAAACQMSRFTHVEIAIGDEYGQDGSMSNVCRIFNDDVGVELVRRSGRNPCMCFFALSLSFSLSLILSLILSLSHSHCSLSSSCSLLRLYVFTSTIIHCTSHCTSL